MWLIISRIYFQIVLEVGEIDDKDMVHVKAANNKEGICPVKFLTEV